MSSRITTLQFHHYDETTMRGGEYKMPNCFHLTRIDEDTPRKLQDIDDDLWFMFEGEVPEPNDKWYKNWYNILGLAYACGKSLQEGIELVRDSDLLLVAEFLDANYTVSSWYSAK